MIFLIRMNSGAEYYVEAKVDMAKTVTGFINGSAVFTQLREGDASRTFSAIGPVRLNMDFHESIKLIEDAKIV